MVPGPFFCVPAAMSLGLLQHDLGRLDDDGHLVSLLQLEIFGTSTRNHAVYTALSYFDDDVGHDVAQLYAGDFSFELVSGR